MKIQGSETCKLDFGFKFSVVLGILIAEERIYLYLD